MDFTSPIFARINASRSVFVIVLFTTVSSPFPSLLGDVRAQPQLQCLHGTVIHEHLHPRDEVQDGPAGLHLEAVPQPSPQIVNPTGMNDLAHFVSDYPRNFAAWRPH